MTTYIWLALVLVAALVPSAILYDLGWNQGAAFSDDEHREYLAIVANQERKRGHQAGWTEAARTFAKYQRADSRYEELAEITGRIVEVPDDS